MKHQSVVQVLRAVEKSMVINDTVCDNSYCTINGKLIVGPGEVKTIDGNRRLKE